MGVFISPAVGISINTWSLADGQLLQGPEWKMGRPTYYIFASSGKESDSFDFWLELEVPRSHYDGNELLDIVLVGHYIHGSQMKSAQFKQFLSQFPGWSYPVGWSASYKSYKFWTPDSNNLDRMTVAIICVEPRDIISILIRMSHIEKSCFVINAMLHIWNVWNLEKLIWGVNMSLFIMQDLQRKFTNVLSTNFKTESQIEFWGKLGQLLLQHLILFVNNLRI